jgi:hypothetical protein
VKTASTTSRRLLFFADVAEQSTAAIRSPRGAAHEVDLPSRLENAASVECEASVLGSLQVTLLVQLCRCWLECTDEVFDDFGDPLERLCGNVDLNP